MFVPWELQVSRAEVADAITGSSSWRAVLDALGYRYHGKTVRIIRKWAARWDIPTGHLSDNRGRPNLRRKYSEAELRQAVDASFSWAETLRRLGYCPSGGNWKTLQKRVAEFGISTDHFDPYAGNRRAGRRRRLSLDEILTERSTYSRTHLKRRLYGAGLKDRRCELCGQGENWNGRTISLILDHINGVRDDHRLENLRIICPNCAAGLDTHCGRKNGHEREARSCLRCLEAFVPKNSKQRYCSRYCGTRQERRPAEARPTRRRIERPPHYRLLHEIDELGYSATGRKHGVSDNAIRKWVRQYERERAVAEGRDPDAIEIPTRTWPNQRREAA